MGSDMVPVSSKEFLDIQPTTDCRFTMKLVRDMIITYGLSHCTKNEEILNGKLHFLCSEFQGHCIIPLGDTETHSLQF